MEHTWDTFSLTDQGLAACAIALIRCRLDSTRKGRERRNSAVQLSLDDFTGLDAAGADANALVPAWYLSFNRTQIDVPAALRNVVRVRNLVTELRAFAAEFANLCHDKLQIT